MRILISGALGFIGSHLTRACLARGDDVIGIDNKSRPATLELPNVHYIFRNTAQALADWRRERCDLIFHCGSPVGAAAMKPETQTLWQIVRDAHKVFDMAQRWKAKVVAFSTPEVFGWGDGTRFTEDTHLEVHLPYAARSEYSIGKMAMECLGMVHPHPWIHFIRPYIVSGPGQNPASGACLPRFVHQAVQGEALTVFGGEQRRQFTHVDDLVAFCMFLLRAAESKTYDNEADGVWYDKQIWHIGGLDAPITIRELAERVVAEVGSGHVEVVSDPAATLGNPYWMEAPEKFVDISKALATGWRPQKGLSEIIHDMVEDARARL